MYKKKIFLLLLFVFCQVKVFSLVVGSNTTPSRESAAFFPAADSNNTMLGFASFEEGFQLEDATTTCTYDDFLPVSGNVELGGGTLYLNQDLVFDNDFRLLIPGTIDGNSKSVEFPKSLSDIVLPYLTESQMVWMVDIDATGGTSHVNSVDWSSDSQYIAVGRNGYSGQEYEVYSFDGSDLTYIGGSHSVSGVDVNRVRWNPRYNQYVAMVEDGIWGEYDLFTYEVVGSSLINRDGEYLYGNGFDLVWHPSGEFIVTAGDYPGGGGNNGMQLKLWEFNTSTGATSWKQEWDFHPSDNSNSQAVYALSFCPGGNYLAVGQEDYGVSTPNLRVFRFNAALGSPLQYNTSTDADIRVERDIIFLDWCPTGTYVAVGLTAGSESLRIFAHNEVSDTITEVVSARVGETKKITGLHWNNDGDALLCSTDNGTSSAFQTYYFNKTTEELFKTQSRSSSTGVHDARWSPDNTRIVRGDNNYDGIVSGPGSSTDLLTFDDVTLVFNSNVLANKNWKIKNACKIVGNGKKLTIGGDVTIELDPGAHLMLQDVCLDDVQVSNLKCLTDNATITFCDSMLQLSRDFTFSRGSMVFEHDVVISGTVKFNYTTAEQSTISQDSTLYLTHGLTFSYDALNGNKNLIVMEDETSSLYLDGATLYSTWTGLRLSGGKLLVDNKVTLSSEGRNTGEAMELNSDLDVHVLGSAVLDMYGMIKYE